MSECPLFSVVIPVFNRPREIQRALRSCFAQQYQGFEVVVVDDASTDGTNEAAQQIADIRVIIVRHTRNQGECSARNTGVQQARGEWIVFLDSDDELLPGALETMAAQARAVDGEVHRLAFSYIHPDGRTTPSPSLPPQHLDYEGYLRWTDSIQRSDFNNCVRRSTFETVQLPEVRVAPFLYHLDFALRFQTLLFPDVVARVHYDASNRLTDARLSGYIQRQMAEASVGVQGVGEILARHGESLRRYAPRIHRSLLRQRFEKLFLSGRIAEGLRAAAAFLRIYPLAANGWATLIAGLFGPAPLATLKWVSAKRRA